MLYFQSTEHYKRLSANLLGANWLDHRNLVVMKRKGGVEKSDHQARYVSLVNYTDVKLIRFGYWHDVQ
jgi:hypothetical protein